MPQGCSIAFTDVVSAFKTVKLMKSKWIASRSANRHIHKLPDHLLVKVFTYLSYNQLNNCFRVCKRWLQISRDPNLWRKLCLRFDHHDAIRPESIVRLIKSRFSSCLTHLELSDACIVPQVLHEVAKRCPGLHHLTLDFSRAVQLRDFSDLADFPCNLKNLTICLSDVIFMEGFMKKVYKHLTSVTCLHVIGTYEQEDGDSENYEVINISKLKSSMPNLTVINMFGVCFFNDSHVDLLSTNCINLRCLALNLCSQVTGESFTNLVKRCPRLDTLLLQQCALEDIHIEKVPWKESNIREFDISCTDLSSTCLLKMLSQMKQLTYLSVSHSEFFTDDVLNALIDKGILNNLHAIDMSHTDNLSESSINRLLRRTRHSLEGLMLAGKTNLGEQFFLNAIASMPNIRIFVCGFSNGWFIKTSMKILIDNIVFTLAQNCPRLQKLELQWDSDCLRHSESSNKFINQLRLRCPHLQSITLADGEYFELVKSNFERTGKMMVVRTTTSHETSIAPLLCHYKQLMFN